MKNEYTYQSVSDAVLYLTLGAIFAMIWGAMIIGACIIAGIGGFL